MVAVLAVVYAGSPEAGMRQEIEPMLTMLPPPLSLMAGTYAWVKKNMCRKLTLKSKFQLSGVTDIEFLWDAAPATGALYERAYALPVFGWRQM